MSKSLDTPGAKSITHSVTWGLNLAIFTNMLQFVGKRAGKKVGTYGQRWGPFWLVLVGMVLMMMDLTRHLVNDSFNIWSMDNVYLKIWVTYVATWTGALCLICGIFWETRFIAKIKAAYNQTRRR